MSAMIGADAAWWVVMRKEVRENLRDRRVMLSALLYGPLFGPLLFALMMGFILGKQQSESEKRLELPVAGAEHAPNFVDFLRREGVVIEAAPDDAEGAIRAQTEDMILRIAPDYGAQWSAGKPARVDLLLDRSRQQTQTQVARVEALVQTYSAQIASQRLRMRGIAPDVATPVTLFAIDLSTPQSRGALLMAMLPYFLVLSAFVGGMYLAIDTTSGERERQSLEPLLINPVARGQIMAGKLLATALFAAASLVVCIAAFVISLRWVPVAALGFDLGLSATTALKIGVLVLPIAFLASSSQTVIASYANSFREAQTYLQFLIIVPAIPSIVLAINPLKPELWMYLTPLFSQSVLINQLVRGETISTAAVAGCIATTLLAALALAALAVRLYSREQLALST